MIPAPDPDARASHPEIRARLKKFLAWREKVKAEPSYTLAYSVDRIREVREFERNAPADIDTLLADVDAKDERIARLKEVAENLDVASRRMSKKTGNLELDTRRDGMREAYFDAARHVRAALAAETRAGGSA